MKTSIITSVLVAFVSVMSLSAGNPRTTVYENVETTDAGVKKEYVKYNNEISAADSKVVYFYDADGKMDSKVFYKWNSQEGWVENQKYEYQYNNENQVSYLTFTKWDDKNKAEMEQLVHIYDNDGNLMAVEKIDLNNEDVAYAGNK